MIPISWIGWFQATASFPVVNDHLTAALERRGWDIRRNVHNLAWSGALTPVSFAFQYPPQSLPVRHPFNGCLSLWEFAGGTRAVPDSFKRVFAEYDLIIVPNQFVYDQYAQSTSTPVLIAPYLGTDPGQYTPTGPVASLEELFPGEAWVSEEKQVILMIGGTDRRHGWDVAEQIMDALPNSVHLIAKLSVHYPRDLYTPRHPRIHLLYADLPDLAPLYRACDVFLMTARGVGFSLPTLDALACGCPVVSTPLSPIQDYANDLVFWGEGGQYAPMGIHHVHDDCWPLWWEPDVESLIEATRRALASEHRLPAAEWVAQWSWDGIAARFEQAVMPRIGGLA